MIRGCHAARRGPAGRSLRRHAPRSSRTGAGRAPDPGRGHRQLGRHGRRRPVHRQGRHDGPRVRPGWTAPDGSSSGGDTLRGVAGRRGGHRSAPVVPPIEGLRDTPYWTNREAISAERTPRVARGARRRCDRRRAGPDVRPVRRGGDRRRGDGRLLPPEEPAAGQVVRTALEADGATVRVGARRCTCPATTATARSSSPRGRHRGPRGGDPGRGGPPGAGRRDRPGDGRPRPDGAGARGRRADARGRAAVGGRRRHRCRHVHAHGDVPGGHRDRRHPGEGRAAGRLPRAGARHVHRPGGRLGRASPSARRASRG